MTFTNVDIELDTLPKLEAAEYHPLHERYPGLVLGCTIAFELVVLAATAFVLTATGSLDRDVWPSLVAAVAVMILIAWYRYKAASVIRYAVRERDVILRSGIFWKKETVQPIKRVQHVERLQGPLDKRFGLAKLKLFSAGTAHFTFMIPGLEANRALGIQNFILEQKKAPPDSSGAGPAARTDDTSE